MLKLNNFYQRAGTLIFGALLICGPTFTSTAHAEIADADFAAAMEKFLGTEKGRDAIGSTMKRFIDHERSKALKLEEERMFKNRISIDPGTSPSKGPKDAPITIIEFSDFECPFCSRGDKIMKEVMERFPEDVRLVFKNLPLDFHKNARPAAKAALAAGKQGKFWEFHDMLFEKQRELSPELYDQIAKDLKLNVDKWKADMKSPAIEQAVKDDEAQAKKAGITGTPGFVVNGVLVKGAFPADRFAEIINKLITEKKEG